MRIRCRPLTAWPAEFSRTRHRTNPFTAPWSTTLGLLERELRHLRASEVVVELALREDEIRLDGWPRSTARPGHPGVIVSFDSRHGPLRYGTDAFPHWQANLRAITLGLEALRRVDRYGIGKRGEQYVGWRALPAGITDLAERGHRLIDEAGGISAALKRHHPDHGGDPDDFAAVQAARG